MNPLIVLLCACAAAYVGRPQPRRRMLGISDIMIGLIGGFAGLSLAYVAQGTGWEIGFPLLIGCSLALGLQSRPRPIT
jgi:hypothetical protein